MRTSRPSELYDRDWLYSKYVNNEISMMNIAKYLHCSYKMIRKAIIKFKIPVRSNKECAQLRSVARKGQSKYYQLNNKEWIYSQYVDSLKSMKDIADEIGCTSWSVENTLKYHGIKTRSAGEHRLLHKDKYRRKSKYPFLNDRDWLYQKACVEKLSYSAIAKIAGAKHFQSVIQALTKFGLFELRRFRPHVVGKSSYEKLNDKKWLRNKYIKEKLSTLEIASIIGCNCALIRKNLMRHKISVRNRSTGHTYKDPGRDGFRLNKKTESIIIGGLLGDAHVGINKDYGNPSYSKSSEHKEYIEYECKILFGDKGKNRVYTGRRKLTDKSFKNSKEVYYFLTTKRHSILMPFFKDWYEKRGKKYVKIIPKTFEISKVALLTWFMDDGYSYVVKSKNYRPQIRVYLCTQCFQYEEIERLSSYLRDHFELHFYTRFHKREKITCGSGYELELSLKDVDNFFKIIGPCPVKCFQYKWKINILKEWLKNNFSNKKSERLSKGHHYGKGSPNYTESSKSHV